MIKRLTALLIMFMLLLSMMPAVYAAEEAAEIQGTGSNTENSFFNLSFFKSFFAPAVIAQPNNTPPCTPLPCIPTPCIPLPCLPPPCLPSPCLFGSLTVTKTLIAPDGFDKGMQFTFTLRNAANAVVGSAAIGHEGSAVFNCLIPGTYTITESDASLPDYNLDVAVSGAASANGGTLCVAPGSQTVAFTNTYVKKTGDLTVTKTLVAPAGFDMGKMFDFTLTNAANVVAGTGTLGSGGSTTFSNLEVGTYTITESDAAVADYDWTVAVSGAASSNGGTLTIAEGSQTVAFTNTYVKQTGDLTITKVLSAPCFFNKCKIFTFTVTDSAGFVAATAALKGGESTTICGLDVGTYTIIESGAAVCGYNLTVDVSGAATSNGGYLTIIQGTQTVTFTNTYAYKTIPCCIKLPCFPICPPKDTQPS